MYIQNGTRMRPYPLVSFLVIVLAAIAFSSTATAFTPFTHVTNVCPACIDERLDLLTLANGDTVQAKIVGSNNDFYVIYRFGEYRMVPNREIKTVKWSGGSKPPSLSKSSQVILKNGKLFNGVVNKENNEPAYLILSVPEIGQDVIIFKDQIKDQYVDGVKL